MNKIIIGNQESNLKKNPEKEYIYWPNRVAKVEQFEDLISGIIK